MDAAKMLQPTVTHLDLPWRTPTSEEDLNAWLGEAVRRIRDKLKTGPARIEGRAPRRNGALAPALWPALESGILIRIPDLHRSRPVRTTLNIDDELLEKARVLSGVQEKTALVREGLKALIERESARRLARLGGSEPEVEAIPRRRPAD
jgi:Arc/MetJ family transcription regulator